MNPMVLRRVKQIRSTNPWMPLFTAVQIADAEENPDVGEYAFLADFEEDKVVTGTVGPFTVSVCTALDDGCQLGDDDVTGTFTDRWESGCIPNTGGRSGAYKWYRPSTYSRTHLLDDLRQRGMSRSVVREQYARILQEEMDDDRERYWLGVVVTVTLGGHKLAGGGSLWGIDQITSKDGRAYLIEVARELIDEAIDAARAGLPEAIIRAERHVSDLRSALDENYPTA